MISDISIIKKLDVLREKLKAIQKNKSRYTPEMEEAKEKFRESFNIAPKNYKKIISEDMTLTSSQQQAKIRVLGDYIDDDGTRCVFY